MSENTPSEEQPESSEDAEKDALVACGLLHVILVGVVAMVAGLLSEPLTRSSGTSWIDLNDVALALVWCSFAAYGVISTYGAIKRWRSLRSVLAMHGLALVLAIPGGLLLVYLRVALLGPF